jgi:hypothetical protein
MVDRRFGIDEGRAHKEEFEEQGRGRNPKNRLWSEAVTQKGLSLAGRSHVLGTFGLLPNTCTWWQIPQRSLWSSLLSVSIDPFQLHLLAALPKRMADPIDEQSPPSSGVTEAHLRQKLTDLLNASHLEIQDISGI